MAVHRLITQPGIFYITFTCYRWLPLIELTNAYDLFYNWFDILAQKGHSLTAYGIMPNHVHLILHFAGGPQSLNTIIGNGKRFIAYEIINSLEKRGENEILKELQLSVSTKDRIRGKKHEVWKDSFDAKECRTEKFLLQKLHYIHNNPCVGKWKLAKEPHHYPHSSALFYLDGKIARYPVRDYLDFLGMYYQEEDT